MNLKWALGLSIVLAVLAVLAGAGSQFTDMGFSPTQVKAVLALFVLLLSIGNAVNSVLIGYGLTNASKLSAAATVPTQDRIASLIATTNGEISQIKTTREIADAVPSNKVVGPDGH